MKKIHNISKTNFTYADHIVKYFDLSEIIEINDDPVYSFFTTYVRAFN